MSPRRRVLAALLAGVLRSCTQEKDISDILPASYNGNLHLRLGRAAGYCHAALSRLM